MLANDNLLQTQKSGALYSTYLRALIVMTVLFFQSNEMAYLSRCSYFLCVDVYLK